jgi:hypothetical protein
MKGPTYAQVPFGDKPSVRTFEHCTHVKQRRSRLIRAIAPDCFRQCRLGACNGKIAACMAQTVWAVGCRQLSPGTGLHTHAAQRPAYMFVLPTTMQLDVQHNSHSRSS